MIKIFISGHAYHNVFFHTVKQKLRCDQVLHNKNKSMRIAKL